VNIVVSIQMKQMEIKNICVIGAGISGLVAAKTFLEEGYEVTVFEKQKELGGVWESSRTYAELTTQSPRDKYAFTDYPMPKSYPEWPKAYHIRDYLKSYAQHFGVMPKIKFETEVTKVERSSKKESWIISVDFKQDNLVKRKKKFEFDFVVVCNGIFNIPKIPYFPGKDDFINSGGKLLHSTHFTDSSLIQGKKVVIVGFGKSATDIATLCANLASKCTLVVRNISWMVPRYLLGFINYKYVLMTPFAEAFFPYRVLKGIEKRLHTFGKPFVSVFWHIIQLILRLQFRLDNCGMVPKKPLSKSITCTGLLAPNRFYQYLRNDKIRVYNTEIAKFLTDGIELLNGKRLKADVVIFATGFRQEVKFLEKKYQQFLIDKNNNFHLYRHLIHPDIPQMGFIGYNSSFFCQLTSEVGSWWLVDYLKGRLILPSRSQMLSHMDTDWNWKKSQSLSGRDSGTCIAPFHFHYLEELMQDMGDIHNAKGWKKILEILTPINESVYKIRRQKLKAEKHLPSEYLEKINSAETSIV